MLNIGQCDSDELLKQVMDHIEDPWIIQNNSIVLLCTVNVPFM
jgi:hypothetical protein